MFRLLKTRSDLNHLKVIAKKLANRATLGDLFLIKGELGAGKTTFTRFFIHSLFIKNSVKTPHTIKSPSFPILINYSLANFEIFHYDLYRLNSYIELVELNIIENIQENITLIEWPEIILRYNQLDKFFFINMKIINSNKREIEIKHTHIKDFDNDF